MSFTFFPCAVALSTFTFGRPVARSTPDDQFIGTNGLREQHLARRAIDRVREAVAVEVHEHLSRRAVRSAGRRGYSH